MRRQNNIPLKHLFIFLIVFFPMGIFNYAEKTNTKIPEHRYPSILSLEKQSQTMDQWLKIRLETILPEVMRREKLDMWIIICREYNEDPVFLTLVPSRWYSARRTTMLVFYNHKVKGIKRFILRKYDEGDFYKAAWTKGETNQWRCLANIISELDPQRIGINKSDTFAFGDGLTASLYTKLINALGEKYTKRLHSAENLAVGWLEKRTPQELEDYPQIVAIAHSIIAEAFSNRVITPGITTTYEVRWWMRNKIQELGLTPWFHPWLDLQRQQEEPEQSNESIQGVIQRGDILHCDLGLIYLGLWTDNQEMAYVLKEGETQVPDELVKALQVGNRLQDLFTAEFKRGITGNQLLKVSLDKASVQGIKAQIYTHPLGFHGHAAGPVIGLWDHQEGVPGKGDYPLFYDTCYAIELNIRTPLSLWNNQRVRIALEQDAAFTTKGVSYLDGRQTTWHVIK